MNNEILMECSAGLETQKTSFSFKKPNQYRVVLFNDDFTPMDFVVDLVINFFNLTKERATAIMLQVHLEGKGSCGVYTYDIAETKVAQVNAYARNLEFPLFCSMEIA